MRPTSLSTAVACLALPVLAGCITVSGSSPSDMKRELQSSFLYRSASAFADDTGQPFDVKGRLRDDQKRYIIDTYQSVVRALLQARKRHDAQLRQTFPGLLAASVEPRILMSDSGLAAPQVNQRGEILIDIRVARLLYRDAVLAGMRQTGLGSVGFMHGWDENCRGHPKTDAGALACFMDLKHRVDRMEGQGMLGMLFDRRSWDLDDDAPFFANAELLMSSVDLQSRYMGMLMFVTAHELGHVVLGHLEGGAARFATPAQLRRAERDADDFAVTLMALATPELAILSNLGFDGIATGFEGFLGSTYRNARWHDGGDSHPASEERLQRARAFHAGIRERQLDDFWNAVKAKVGE